MLSKEQIQVAQINSSVGDPQIAIQEGVNTVIIDIRGLWLNAALYYFSLILYDKQKKGNLKCQGKAKEITVKSNFGGVASYLKYATIE